MTTIASAASTSAAIAGSVKTSHYLFFDAIDPTLLPQTPDPNEWWCINYEDEIKVIKIRVCPPSEINEDFPDEI